MYTSDVYRRYLPVVIAALTVLILGFWNPKALQAKNHGGRRPSYLWLSLAALIAGIIVVWFIKV